MSETPNLTTLAAGIVEAYVARSAIPVRELPELVRTVHASLAAISAPAPAAIEAPSGKCATAGEIRKSIRPDGLVSFLDGRSYKTLKRHLHAHGLDPASYRARYGLPSDYPMAAPSYAARRAEIAREIGLGRYGSMAQRGRRQAAA